MSAGYDLADVEAAWRALDAEAAAGVAGSGQAALAPGAYLSASSDEPAPPARQPVTRSWQFWLTLIGTILLAYLLPTVLSALTAGLFPYDSPLYTVGSLLPWGLCGLV